MEQVRRHGLGAKHMSTGERSMLSAFQESARAVGQQETGTLVPFWRFYDTIEKDLDHGIVQVFSRAFEAAEKDKGLFPADVPVLKALYLVRYIDYLPSNLDNVCILMADKIEVDKVALREAVKGSLDRLIGQNYVARSGDVYSFLTDEEQDVARDIAATSIEVSAVVERMKDLVFGDILSAQKHRKGANDFPFDRYLDDTAYGSLQNGMKLNILSVASEGGALGRCYAGAEVVGPSPRSFAR